MSQTIYLNSGATEADIKTALASLSSGGTLVLPENETISIVEGISVDVGYRNITIDLNGSTLQQAGDVTVLQGFGAQAPNKGAVLGTDADGRTTVTYESAATLEAGDWVKVFATDVLEGDHHDGGPGQATRLGQAMQVVSVEGNTAVLAGELIDKDDYKTDVSASQVISGELIIKNGSISGDQSHDDWTEPLLMVKSAINPQIDHVTVENGNSMGMHFANTVNAEVLNSIARNLKDNPEAGQYGYGVHSSMSVGTTVVGLYAEGVRHATDNNSWDISPGYYSAAGYGADIGFTVRDTVAHSTSSYAYSWHSEAREASLSNVMAFDTFGFLGARGIDNEIDGGYGVNLRYGVQVYEYGDGDGRGLVINDVHLQAISNTAVYTTGDPRNNLLSNSSFETTWTQTLEFGDALEVVNSTIRAGVLVGVTLTGTEADDVLLATMGDDVILGDAGFDFIWGGKGEDRLTGGGGRDSFAYNRIDEGGDVITDFRVGAKGDRIDLSALAKHENWSADPIGDGVLRFVQDGANAHVEVLSGGAWTRLATLNNVAVTDLTLANLVLDLAPAWLDPEQEATPLLAPVPSAGSASDAPAPSAETDVHAVIDGYVLMEGTDNTNYMAADDRDTKMIGGDRTDYMFGGAGDDVLIGGKGMDSMVGGLGDDLYQIDNVLDVATEKVAEGTDTIVTTLGSYTLRYNFENLAYAGSGWFQGVGNSADNILTGGTGRDTLNGAGGADTLMGGLGDDRYVIADWLDTIIENADGGNDAVEASISVYTLGANLEELTYTGTANFTGTGNELDNVLRGGAGNDTLSGEAGADTMMGGAGNDIYVVDDAGDFALEQKGEGVDSIRVSLDSYTLYYNFENLTFTGTGNFAGIGNSLANVLTGAAGNDSLDGKAGSDTMVGGPGDDAYFIDSFGDTVRELAGEGTDTVNASIANYTLGGNLENLTYIGTGSFRGTGNSGANVIIAGADNDFLDGRAGADTLIGGTGNDTYRIADSLDTIIETTGGGADTVETSLGYYALGTNLERLTYIGTGTFSGVGNDLDNILRGGAGNDTLDGKAGADRMVGGAGDDTYVVDHIGDLVRENADAGTDTIRATLNAYELGADVENLTFIGSGNFSGRGNALANTIRGAAGNDILDGGMGADTMHGGTGDDTFIVDDLGDAVVEWSGQGTDTVETMLDTYLLANNLENLVYSGNGAFTGTGNAAANILSGGAGNDVLHASGGNDIVTGGAGDDRLTGGIGNDIFVFRALSGHDVINDFAAHRGGSNGDVIELHDRGISSFAVLQDHMVQDGLNTVISFDDGASITLNGVSRAQVTAADFIFL